MKKKLAKYAWLFEMIGCALLIGLGIVMKFVPSVLLVLVGLVFFVLGLFRIVPLLKTTDDKLLKALYAVELFIDMGAGIALFILGIKKDTEAIDDLRKIFGFIIAGILYLRGLVYLFAVSFKKEDAKIWLFFIHIGLITLATVIIARGGFTLATLGWVLLALAILSAIFVGVDSIKKYTKYRNEEYALKKTKDINVKEEKVNDAPTADEVIIRTPQDENSDQDTLNA
ncbi:MAG: hypothetical protein J6W64_02320 [Bacilli bacterium]|nr:hypothetical protein [Bacilli bacterium]